MNQRGFLVDRKGNIVNKNGDIMFRQNQLSEDGDYPKFFDFSKFDQKRVMGRFDKQSEMGLPVISEDPELPAGYGRDNDHNIVNEAGLRADPVTGNILDEEGNVVFNRAELGPDGNLAPMLRKAAAKYEGKENFDLDPN